MRGVCCEVAASAASNCWVRIVQNCLSNGSCSALFLRSITLVALSA